MDDDTFDEAAVMEEDIEMENEAAMTKEDINMENEAAVTEEDIKMEPTIKKPRRSDPRDYL